MATLPTLASMMLQLPPKIDQYDPLEVARQQNLVQGGRTTNATALIQLEELRRQQDAQAMARQAIQQDPSLILGGGGGPQSTLASLGPGMAPGGGPMTQQQVMPGQPPGMPQPVPGGQDLSRFATRPPGGPQSTLAGLQGQGQPAPQSRLEALMRQNPEAGMQILKQQQAMQDRQWKMQDQELDRREKVATYIAKQAQGITSQDDLDAFRQSLQQTGMSQVAAALPQFYSAAGMQPFIARGATALENAQAAKARADALKSGQEAQTEEWRRTVLLPELARPAPAAGGGEPAPATGTPAPGRPQNAPAEVETAVQEAVRLYPQVRPEIVRAIIARESNFDAKAVSPKGAQGYMQLMPGTAKDMGVDDPFDTTQNIRGGVRYFAQLLMKYGGDEAKALAAYNAGPGAVDAAQGDLTKLPRETQDYVPNVLKRAQVGATARGPATGPQVQRFDQQIAALTRKAEIAAASGERAYADTMHKEIDRLTQERNRLEEIPRAVERQTALQKGELEKAGEAERIKAESERASKEEIDAINRGLPTEQRIPYATTRAEIRKRGLVGGIPIPEKGNEELIARSTIVNQLGELKTKFGDLPTGPIQARLNQYRELLGVNLTDDAVAYSTLLNTVRNRVVNALSGAAVSPDEAKRILAELPDEKTSPQAFRGRLEAALTIAEDVYKRRAQYYRRSGHSVPESLMTPYWDEPLPGATGSGSAAATPGSNVDKFKAIKKP